MTTNKATLSERNVGAPHLYVGGYTVCTGQTVVNFFKQLFTMWPTVLYVRGLLAMRLMLQLFTVSN